MKKSFKITLSFQLLNLLLLITLENIYDWQGRYFVIGLISYMLPNIVALLLNTISVSLIVNQFKVEKNLFVYLVFVFFLTNELSFAIIEQQLIFFGFFIKTSPNIIAVDKMHFILISLTPILASGVLWLLKKKIIV